MGEQRSYTHEDSEAMVAMVAVNGGYVKPTAEFLGVPRKTLEYKVERAEALDAMTHVPTHEELVEQAAPIERAEESPSRELAKPAELRQKTIVELANAYLELATEAVGVARAKIQDASPYHAALISAISTDKWAMITGRPSSRSEVHTFHYVQPDALRNLAAKVIDVTPTAPLTPNQESALPPPKGRKHTRKRAQPAPSE